MKAEIFVKNIRRTDAVATIRAYRNAGYAIRFEDDPVGGWLIAISYGDRTIARVVLYSDSSRFAGVTYRWELV